MSPSHAKPTDTPARPGAERHGIKVRDVMTRDVITIGPGAPFPEIVQCLLENNVSGLPVVDRQGTLLGMVTEADLITKEAYEHGRRRHLGLVLDHISGRDPDWIRKSAARQAGDLMTRKLDTASPDDDLTVAARRMLEGHHKRLPVVEDGRLVGIVARHDLLKPFCRSDAELAGDVQAILADPLRTPEEHRVTVTVHEGVVTLNGTTRFPSDIPVLRAVIGAVPGVVDVEVALEAREREPDPDSALAQRPPW